LVPIVVTPEPIVTAVRLEQAEEKKKKKKERSVGGIS